MIAVRFGFGGNWRHFIERNFSEERVETSRTHILDFLGRDTLKGLTFLDVGCGSGLHSLAAHRAGAARIVSIDLDPQSVEITKVVRDRYGASAEWQVLEGSVLDAGFLSGLAPADVVYAWGVLHHTGDQWAAFRNVAGLMAADGCLYIALYTSGITDPGDGFWLDVKQRYNRAGWLRRRVFEVWYIWRFPMRGQLRNLPDYLELNRTYNKNRGMSLYTDIRDWLGGWPMEFSSIEEVKSFAERELDLQLLNMETGQANSEYLFSRVGQGSAWAPSSGQPSS